MFKKLNIGSSITIAIMSIVTIFLLITSIILVFNFRTTAFDNIKYSSREINKQVIMNYENYIDGVIETANYISSKTSLLSESNELLELKQIYIQAKDISDDIVSIVLLDRFGQDIINSNNQQIRADLTNKYWFGQAYANPEIFHFSSPHTQDVFLDSTQEVITVTKVISYYNQEGLLVEGVLTIDLNTYNIIALSNKTNLGENGHILIFNNTGEYIYSNNEACTLGICESKDLAEALVLGGERVVIDGQNMYLNVNTLSHTRWNIATYINIESIYTSQQTILITAIVLFASALFISFILSKSISSRISSPMSKLSDHMSHIDYNSIPDEITLNGQIEVVELSNSFNDMIREIKSLMGRLVQEQKEKRKSEFFALQMQINPHFLYNTLDSIVWLAENNRNDEVVEMVVALSRFFRISISKGENIIPIELEIEHARNYLNIQKIRYNKQFDFEFDVDVKTFDYTVVKLILQPLIENAINHGISSEESGGFIKITSKFVDNQITFDIMNNGYGLTQDQINMMYKRMKDPHKAQSIGLRNVYQRLKIYYGQEADIIITSVMDEYTSLKIVIPARKEG